MLRRSDVRELRIEAGFQQPLRHRQGTATSARLLNVISWDEWRNPEGGNYVGLAGVYGELGIWEGCGEWYQSAWEFDDSISLKLREKWRLFLDATLEKIELEDYWEWDDEDDDEDDGA